MKLRNSERLIPTPDMSSFVRVTLRPGTEHPKRHDLYIVRTEFGELTPMFGTQFGWNTSQSTTDHREFDTKYKIDDSHIKYWIEVEEVENGEDA